MGLAVVPSHLVAAEPTLRAIGPSFQHSDIWLVVHSAVARTARVRAVMDFIITIARADHAMLRGAV